MPSGKRGETIRREWFVIGTNGVAPYGQKGVILVLEQGGTVATISVRVKNLTVGEDIKLVYMTAGRRRRKMTKAEQDLVDRTVERLTGTAEEDAKDWWLRDSKSEVSALGRPYCCVERLAQTATTVAWFCTRTPGHWGDHVAMSGDNTVLARWPQKKKGDG